MTIQLYTWNTPNGRKISVALEEMGLPYTVHPVNLGQGEQRAPDFLKISPNGRIPAIVDLDGPGGGPLSVFESGAILLYLGEKSGKFLPADLRRRVPVLEWLMWQMGGVGPMLGQAHHFLRFNPGKAPYAEARYGNEAKRLYGVADKRLATHGYLSGDNISIADFATWPWISRFEWQGIDMAEFPNVRRWYLELADRPGVQRGYDVPAMGNTIPLPG